MRVKTDYIDYDKVDEKTRASMDRLFSAPRRGYWARKRAFDIIVYRCQYCYCDRRPACRTDF